MKKLPKKFVIRFKELPPAIVGREVGMTLGQAYDDCRIDLQHGQKGKVLMDTALHEMLHLICPSKDHKWICRVAKLMTDGLWKIGYRRTL